MGDAQMELNEALYRAAQKGDLKTVEGLILSGANIHAFDELSNTALHYAVISGNRHLVHRLLELGADINFQNSEESGETAIILAVESGHFGIIKLLLNLGADPYLKGWMAIDALDRAEMRKDALGDRIKDLILRDCPPPKERLKRKYKR